MVNPLKELLEHKVDQAKRDLEEKQKEEAMRDSEFEGASAMLQALGNVWDRTRESTLLEIELSWIEKIEQGFEGYPSSLRERLLEGYTSLLRESQREVERLTGVLKPLKDEIDRAEAAFDQASDNLERAHSEIVDAQERLESVSANLMYLEHCT